MAALELEVPVFSPGSAQVALTRASRIELNRAGSYPKGGLTPELSDVQSLRAVAVPLRISKYAPSQAHLPLTLSNSGPLHFCSLYYISLSKWLPGLLNSTQEAQ